MPGTVLEVAKLREPVRNIPHPKSPRGVEMMAVAGEECPSFSVGDSFRSFSELEEKLQIFKAKKYIELWRRDARTIKAVQNRINRAINPSLKYYELKYCCIHGGRAFKPKGQGIRHTS